jgi:hypothetical protein
MKLEDKLQGLKRKANIGRSSGVDGTETSMAIINGGSSGSELDTDNTSVLSHEFTNDAEDITFLTNDSSSLTTSEYDNETFSVSSWTTFTLPMERERGEYNASLISCGELDVMSSTKEGFYVMADMFLHTISNAIQAGQQKKTQLTNTMKTKFDEKMEKNRKARNEKKKKRLEQLAEEKRIEREIQMRNDVINARDELVAVANAWREGK